MSARALDVENVAVSYGAIPALRDVSLTVDPGQIVAVVGPNGAGKTTLVRAIAGLERLRNGSVALSGTGLSNQTPERRVRLGLGVVPQGRRVFPESTVRENLWAGAYSRRTSSGVAEDTDRYLTMFPSLAARADADAGVLSGGEQQMLALARALMGRPNVLLLDEPSMGLAPIMVNRIFEALATLREQGTTMLLVEQNAARALEIADRLYVLRGGEVAASDLDARSISVEELVDQYLGL